MNLIQAWLVTIFSMIVLVAVLFFAVEAFLMTRYTVRLRHWTLSAMTSDKPLYPFLLSDFLRGDLSYWRSDREHK